VNPDQLRAAINCGRTGEKAAYPDPAAAPLGTDEEAAGTPISSQACAQAYAMETQRARPRQRDPARTATRARWVPITSILGAFALLVAAVMGWIVLR